MATGTLWAMATSVAIAPAGVLPPSFDRRRITELEDWYFFGVIERDDAAQDHAGEEGEEDRGPRAPQRLPQRTDVELLAFHGSSAARAGGQDEAAHDHFTLAKRLAPGEGAKRLTRGWRGVPEQVGRRRPQAWGPTGTGATSW